MKRENISMPVIRRLPRYYRFLGELQSGGAVRISSRELSARLGLTASQVRQDLNCFGGFGQQGYGYNVEQLRQEIAAILGLDRRGAAVLIGAGNLGRAVANHMAFDTMGFQLVGIFDKKESVVGQMVRGMPVRPVSGLDEFCRANLPRAAVLCVSASAAETLAGQLVSLGVRAFWNFSHYDIALRYPGVIVENVHMGDSLMALSFRLHEADQGAENDRGIVMPK